MNKLPCIVLVGRQNVGKSTLFNRLIKSRKAIIDSTPGVTRDLIMQEVIFEGIKANLIDSGGICDDRDETNLAVQKKTIQAQYDADLILFLVEAGNPVPIEEEYIDFIRRSGKDVILVINKCDSPEKDIFASEYYSYGFKDIIAISASHNRNIDELSEKVYDYIKEIKPDEKENVIEPDVKISILGKPNVGKSSLLNKFINKDRSIVSSIAGTTRDIIDEQFNYKNKLFMIIDTAGIRRKSKVKEDLEYYSVNRALKTINQVDVIFLVIDSLENISDQDKKISDQIVKSGKGLIVLLNKWDLQKKENASFEDSKNTLLFKFPIFNYVPILPVSAKTGEGLNKVLDTAFVIKKELQKKIDTPSLNDFIQEVLRKYSPSSKKGILKIFYGTQTSTAPVEFIFFINNKKLLSNNYKQYIINNLRKYYGYTGVPIKVIFRDKKSS